MSAVFVHHGPWNESSRAHPALKFIEKYVTVVDSCDLSAGPDDLLAQDVVYHNGDGRDYVNAQPVWEWMKKLFTVFDRIQHTILSATVVTTYTGEYQIIIDSIGTFVLKSDPSHEEIKVPRLVIFTAKKVEGSKHGYLISQGKIFWDSKVVLQKMK